MNICIPSEWVLVGFEKFQLPDVVLAGAMVVHYGIKCGQPHHHLSLCINLGCCVAFEYLSCWDVEQF